MVQASGLELGRMVTGDGKVGWITDTEEGA